ncbi:MAG: hypothetical protein ACPGXK_03365 [Phycisphaerae bacterium]
MIEWKIMAYAWPALLAGLFYLRTAAAAIEGVENGLKRFEKKEKAKFRKREDMRIESSVVFDAAPVETATEPPAAQEAA